MESLRPSRPMKYPYTLSAKVAQFPYKFYWKHSIMFKYLLLGYVASLPLFYKITTIAKSEANIKKWEEIRRKEAEHHH